LREAIASGSFAPSQIFSHAVPAAGRYGLSRNGQDPRQHSARHAHGPQDDKPERVNPPGLFFALTLMLLLVMDAFLALLLVMLMMLFVMVHFVLLGASES
jgi:hypothetical protein